MTVIADLLAQAKAIDTELPRVAPSRSVYSHLRDIPDFDYPEGTDAQNAFATLYEFDGVDGGTYTITITFQDGTTITTDSLDYDDGESDIQTAIDSAATNVIGEDYANGDIQVEAASSGLDSNDVTLAFTGDTVAGRRVLSVTIDGSGLTVGDDPAEDGEEYYATGDFDPPGQPKRANWAFLVGLGIVSADSVPAVGDDASVTPIITDGKFPHGLDAATMRAIIEEISILEDNANTRTALLSALGL